MRDLALNIQNITTSATWISQLGNNTKKILDFTSAGTIGLITGIEAGDAGIVCLKTQVSDIIGQSTYILTYIKDISFW